MKPEPEIRIFRNIAFPLPAFDYLKDFQRAYEVCRGARINNNEALAIIMAEHQQMNEKRGVRNEQGFLG